jgi:hypothetical protein
MEYFGLFPKFRLNRPLNEDEKKYQLKQRQASDLAGQSIMPDVKVIRINSGYLELVDKYYAGKGFGSLIAAVGFFGASLLFLTTVIDDFPSIGWKFGPHEEMALAMSLICIPTMIMTFKLLKTEWFAWTHYPIRFDYRNQLVHIFRLDGTTRSVPWEKVFFTLGLSHRKEFNKDYYISGHVLAEDNETVIDSFCLPATHSERQPLERHWEFVRRYMEEGPESVIKSVDFCLPLVGRREGYSFGLLYSLSLYDGAPLFLLPLFFTLAFFFSIPRYIAMITSRVPVWPESIESQCRIEADDPYCIDASKNPRHLWRNIFRPSAGKKE